MSLEDHRGAVYLFQKWMREAARDIATGGEVKPARPIAPPAPKPTIIGRLERFEWRVFRNRRTR